VLLAALPPCDAGTGRGSGVAVRDPELELLELPVCGTVVESMRGRFGGWGPSLVSVELSLYSAACAAASFLVMLSILNSTPARSSSETT
jgi:hypothetical protein